MAATGLAYSVIKHWAEHRPIMYNRLHEEGKLWSEAMKAAHRTLREIQVLRDEGVDEETAWEMARENIIYLPEEPGLEEMDKSIEQKTLADKMWELKKEIWAEHDLMIKHRLGERDYLDR